jgi:arsenate reductase-like glutaredoxin family protein
MDVEERDFFKESFSEDEVKELAAPVGLSEIFARRSPSLKKLGLAGSEISEEEMLRLMLEEPRLIRRPLVKIGERLLVGANLKTLEAALEAGA